MNAARLISIVFAGCALVTGLVAAFYWRRSSEVVIDPGWSSEPVIDDWKHAGWISAILVSSSEVASLNKIAARWSAAAAFFAGVSSFVGSWGC
jgi:phosphosulfolactate phosphohydrolase-like enzyme